MPISAKVERIIREVGTLSARARDELMQALALTDRDAVSAEWSLEIHRRAREIDEGKVRLVDEEDFLRKLRTF
jgi:hypothetical protein